MLQVAKPNGNRVMAGFYKSDPLFFLGCIRDGVGVDRKPARHMEQAFQPI